jgi:hypothetical protein
MGNFLSIGFCSFTSFHFRREEALDDIQKNQKQYRIKSFSHPDVKRSDQSDDRDAYSPILAARLLDLYTAAAYLGVSYWTVRDLEAAGVLRRIRIPLTDGHELRKVLFDKADLDRLIEMWKDPT